MNTRPVSICLFGPHLVRRGTQACRLRIRGSTLELLAYLVVNAGRDLRRDFVAEKMWSASSISRQRSAINSAIWRISKALGSFPEISLTATESTIRLEIAASVVVDAVTLSGLVLAGTKAMDERLAEQLAASLEATDAPFLSGLTPDWALAERERFANIRLRGQTQLMHWYGDCRRYEDALVVGRQLLAKDPFRENAQIDMMWLYVLNGQRAHALRHYEAYAQLLEKELAIEPMRETRALYDHIRCDMNCTNSIRENASESIAWASDSRARFDCMLESIEQSRRELYQSLRVQLGSP